MSRRKKTALAEKLDKLAEKIADGALAEGTPLDKQLDAMKILSAYHLGLSKIKLKADDDDEDAPSFTSFKDRLKVVGEE